jgi:threonylcarbamoyladenosine tRNA methylthiotransferase MtaB
LPVKSVLSVIESLIEEGYQEVVLTGVHLGKYGVDLGGEMNLNRLLHAVGEQGYPCRIRLSSLQPKEVNEELVEMVASENWLCKHLHIPLQSGDDEVLSRMNRPYTTREFARLIENVHARMPHGAIGVDVMAGFPGERPASHENTLRLIRDLPVSYLHVFPFSPRPGTAAIGLRDQVEAGVVKERSGELRRIGQEKRTAFYRSCLRKHFKVLSEGWYAEEERILKGTSDNYLPVIFRSQNHPEGLVTVCADRVEKNRVVGTLVPSKVSSGEESA